MFLVALGDFASGILVAHILIKITGCQLPSVPPLAIYAISAALAVLPDLDILIQTMVRKKPEKISDHRDIFHKPLAIIPIFVSIYIFSPFWAYLIGSCLLAHFIHDSTGSGYGVKWFYPFSENTFKFCSRSIICIWTPEETAKNPWKPALDEWLEEYYLRLTVEGFVGITLFFITLIIILIW